MISGMRVSPGFWPVAPKHLLWEIERLLDRPGLIERVSGRMRVGRTLLDRAPADELALEIRDETAGRVRLRGPTVDLRAAPTGALLDGKRGPSLSSVGTDT
jgi:hypothetical protein